MQNVKFLSLFSGIEAASVAWEPLGWECVGFSEIEPFPCAVLAHHYPDVPNLGDVTKITEEAIKNLGQIDLVVFGSPCQNLSVAGNRKGLQGESSGLFYAAIRIIEYARKHCGARFALWENVPGAFSSNKGDDFREVVRELSANRDINTPENGWGNTGVALGENGLVEWRVLDAQYFGLAQRRKRVFAIVDFRNWQDRPPILLEPKGVCGDTPPGRETGQGFATDTQTGVGVQALPINTMTCQGRPSDNGRMGDGIDGESDPSPTLSVNHHHAVAYSIIGDATPKIGEDIYGTLRSQGGGGIVPPSVVYGLDSQQPPARLTEEYCGTLVASNYKEPMGVFCVHGTQDPITSETTANCLGRNNGQENVIAIAGNIIGLSPQNGGNGDGFDEEVCYTLTTADRHAVAANSIIRRLTPTECEILQGFPRNYTKIPYRKKPADQCPDSPRYKALGNSMAVPVMRWIGERINKAIFIKERLTDHDYVCTMVHIHNKEDAMTSNPRIQMPKVSDLPRELTIPPEIYQSEKACGEFIITLNESLAYIGAMDKLFRAAKEVASQVMLERLEVTGQKHFAFDFGTFSPRISDNVGFPTEAAGGKQKAFEWLKDLVERDIIDLRTVLDLQQSRLVKDTVSAVEELAAKYNEDNPDNPVAESPFNHFVETKLSSPQKRAK